MGSIPAVRANTTGAGPILSPSKGRPTSLQSVTGWVAVAGTKHVAVRCYLLCYLEERGLTPPTLVYVLGRLLDALALLLAFLLVLGLRVEALEALQAPPQPAHASLCAL